MASRRLKPDFQLYGPERDPHLLDSRVRDLDNVIIRRLLGELLVARQVQARENAAYTPDYFFTMLLLGDYPPSVDEGPVTSDPETKLIADIHGESQADEVARLVVYRGVKPLLYYRYTWPADDQPPVLDSFIFPKSKNPDDGFDLYDIDKMFLAQAVLTNLYEDYDPQAVHIPDTIITLGTIDTFVLRSVLNPVQSPDKVFAENRLSR